MGIAGYHPEVIHAKEKQMEVSENEETAQGVIYPICKLHS